jgi:hypothetical protein
VAGVRDERAVEGEQLSRLTMAVSDALVDLNVLPIQGIPVTPHVSNMQDYVNHMFKRP